MSVQPRLLTQRTVQFRGSALARAVLRHLGWTVQFDGLPGRQGVIVVYPHTSNVDFLVGVMVKWAVGIQANFWGKDSLFRIPILGPWMKWLGGIPVNRSAPGGLVEQAASHLRQCRETDAYAWLVVAPEGTRRLTEGWRSGFYRVASQAQVPIGVAAFDYAQRQVRFQFLELSGDPVADMAAIAQALHLASGYRPEQASPIKLV